MTEYDFFNSKEFKSLPTFKKFLIRLKIAFFETLHMY